MTNAKGPDSSLQPHLEGDLSSGLAIKRSAVDASDPSDPLQQFVDTNKANRLKILQLDLDQNSFLNQITENVAKNLGNNNLQKLFRRGVQSNKSFSDARPSDPQPHAWSLQSHIAICHSNGVLERPAGSLNSFMPEILKTKPSVLQDFLGRNFSAERSQPPSPGEGTGKKPEVRSAVRPH